MKKSLLIIASLLLCLTSYADCYLVEGGYGSKTTKSKDQVIYSTTFSGTDGYVSYSASGYSSGLSIVLQYSTNGGSSWTSTDSYVRGSGDRTKTIPTTANAIRFITSTSNGGRTHTWAQDYKVSNVCVRKTAEKSLALNGTAQFATKAGFGKAEQLSTTITLDAVNLSGQALTVSCTNTTYFSVSADQINVSNSDCEGVASVTLYFNTTTETPAGDYNTTVTISHATSGKSVQVPVTAKVTEALISSINWDQSFTSLLSINNPDPIVLNATVVDKNGTVAGANIVYTSADPSVVSIAGNVLTIVGDGRTTITATYTSNNEEVRTSASNTKLVFVSDGSTCNTILYYRSKNDRLACNGTEITWGDFPASSISLNYQKLTGITFDGTTTLTAYDKSNNARVIGSFNSNSTDWKTAAPMELRPTERRIVLSNNAALGEAYSHFIGEVVILQATYLEKITTDLGNVQGDNSANASVNFKYSNLPTAISASLEGESTIAVSATPVGTGCGAWNDNATISLVFTPKTTGQRQYTYSGNVVLSAGANEGLKTIKIPVNITIDMPFGNLTHDFAMFYNEDEVTVDADAYYASWTEIGGETALELIQINENVPAQTPVLLHNAKKDFYTFSIAEEHSAWTVDNNAFIHTSSSIDAANDENYNYYVLASKNNEVAFYKFTGTIPAGKVVLVWDKSEHFGNAPTRFDMNMEGNVATALLPVWANDNSEEHMNGLIYTVMGLPVSNMSQPGIYIMNGKKYIVK